MSHSNMVKNLNHNLFFFCVVGSSDYFIFPIFETYSFLQKLLPYHFRKKGKRKPRMTFYSPNEMHIELLWLCFKLDEMSVKKGCQTT